MSIASDISWSGPAGTFNLRVAAVILRGDQVLLCTVDGLDYWFLPGGRVQLGSVEFRPAGLIPVLPELTATLRHVVLTTA